MDFEDGHVVMIVSVAEAEQPSPFPLPCGPADAGCPFGTEDVPVVSNDCMRRESSVAPWRMSVFVLTLLLPMPSRSPAFQQPVRQSEQETGYELKLTPAEEKDSYEIYSMLLRTEMPPQGNI